MKKLIVATFLVLFFAKQTDALVLNPQTETVTQSLDSINKAVQGEKVEDFNSIIAVNKDGSIAVTEIIKYYFDSYRHGIYRNIPFTKYDKGKRYDLQFDFQPVTDASGNKYQVKKSRQGEQWVLQIGDPNTTITGEHTYVISYSVKGALGYFADHDEIYWNTTGTGWDVPIQYAHTTLTLPEKLDEQKIRLACYTGEYNSKRRNCTGESNGQTTTIHTTLFLNNNEGLTVVVGFPKNIVAVLKPEEYVPFFERWYGKITLVLIGVGAVFWYLILPIWLVVNWYRNGRDPEVGIPLTAGFDPPKAGKRFLTPAETGTLIDETVQNRDIFASLVDLARRGYLKIEEPKKKDFWLRKLNKQKSSDTLEPFEKNLLSGVFKDGEYVQLKKAKLYETIDDIKKLLYQDMVDDGYFKTNPQTTRTWFYALGTAALLTLNLVLAFVAFLFGKNMPRKTIVGATQANVAKGLKNFLTSQERQLSFMADRQMMFEKLLPFAVAFGVEKIWAKRFADFDLKQPDWYKGYPGSTFNSIYLASALSNSYGSFSISSTPPSSSSSSGFGGGGFSGGGGGGGGGGSW